MTQSHEITGSEKQIAWATDIRNRVTPVIDHMRTHETCDETVNRVLDAVEAQTTARFWIDTFGDVDTSYSLDSEPTRTLAMGNAMSAISTWARTTGLV